MKPGEQASHNLLWIWTMSNDNIGVKEVLPVCFEPLLGNGLAIQRATGGSRLTRS